MKAEAEEEVLVLPSVELLPAQKSAAAVLTAIAAEKMSQPASVAAPIGGVSVATANRTVHIAGPSVVAAAP
ncbi:MAG: hypothetical protein NXI03_10950, partial [Alphaproteobacteria bacterium]|nr:hypothetical protein [Alphaproteobacteria bacterium]